MSKAFFNEKCVSYLNSLSKLSILSKFRLEIKVNILKVYCWTRYEIILALSPYSCFFTVKTNKWCNLYCNNFETTNILCLNYRNGLNFRLNMYKWINKVQHENKNLFGGFLMSCCNAFWRNQNILFSQVSCIITHTPFYK